MDIHVALTSAEAEALMAAGGPTHRENRDLETGRDKVLAAYRDFYAAQAVDYMAQSGYDRHCSPLWSHREVTLRDLVMIPPEFDALDLAPAPELPPTAPSGCDYQFRYLVWWRLP